MIKLRILRQEIILDYPGEPLIITGGSESKRGNDSGCRGQSDVLAQAQTCMQLLETRKGKEMGSVLQSPEGTQPCRPILDFQHPDHKIINFWFDLSHKICGNFLHQKQELAAQLILPFRQLSFLLHMLSHLQFIIIYLFLLFHIWVLKAVLQLLQLLRRKINMI